MENFSDENENIIFVNISYVINLGNLSPDIFTNEIGIQPTSRISKGDKYLGKVPDPKTKTLKTIWRTHESGIWTFETKYAKDVKLPLSVDSHMLYLLDLLEGRKHIISTYLAKYDIAVYVQQKLKYFDPVHFSASTISRMSQLCSFIEVFLEIEHPAVGYELLDMFK